MRVALVHEYLNQFGGAERMLASLAEIFPDAAIYTLLYDERMTRGLFKDRTIYTSFLQKFPGAIKHHERYPLLMPMAIEQFDLSDYDLVISVSASFAKGVITKPNTRHICYCLTPPRFLWDNSQKFGKEFGFPKFIRKIMPPFVSYLRLWDRYASERVDEYWKISNYVGQRIQKYYHRPATLVFPPVSVEKFPLATTEPKDYFFMVGRLVSYKKFDIAIQAFNDLKLPLKIAGIGPELVRLKKMAGPNIEFLGQINDDDLSKYYREAKALIFPQEEDFGIVPLEAMASGRPVIAYRAGGALETVVEGETGLFFDSQTPESLKEAVVKFWGIRFNPQKCRLQVEKFNVEKFKNNVLISLGI